MMHVFVKNVAHSCWDTKGGLVVGMASKHDSSTSIWFELLGRPARAGIAWISVTLIQIVQVLLIFYKSMFAKLFLSWRLQPYDRFNNVVKQEIFINRFFRYFCYNLVFLAQLLFFQ
jgi:hypothetical protein